MLQCVKNNYYSNLDIIWGKKCLYNQIRSQQDSNVVEESQVQASPEALCWHFILCLLLT